MWLIEVVGDGFEGTRNPDAERVFELMHNAGYQAFAANETLERATGPRRDATNFLFIDNALTLDDVLGPKEERVPVYKA